MSEKDSILAYNLLKRHNITGLPISITIIAMIDRDPYAYKIEYIVNSTKQNTIILNE